nr:MAG TPA: hypothetical protein [Caudoviricetes sp.]
MVSVELGSIPSQGAGAGMACACLDTEHREIGLGRWVS